VCKTDPRTSRRLTRVTRRHARADVQVVTRSIGSCRGRLRRRPRASAANESRRPICGCEEIQPRFHQSCAGDHLGLWPFVEYSPAWTHHAASAEPVAYSMTSRGECLLPRTAVSRQLRTPATTTDALRRRAWPGGPQAAALTFPNNSRCNRRAVSSSARRLVSGRPSICSA
jgi:hypothetical protein